MTQPDIDSRLAVQEALAKAHSQSADAQFSEIKDMLLDINTKISLLEDKFDKKFFHRIE